MLLHLHRGYHSTKHHLHIFHVKHNVSVLTMGLLIVLAIQINFLYFLGMMPIQTASIEAPLSFAGSTLPILTQIAQDIISIF